MAYLMRMAVDYGRSNGFTGDFYIEPKPKEPTKHQYDFDVSTVLAFLRKYGLDKDFKMNIEANHATLAGHTFQHELRVARDNGVFGSIDANKGDMLLGWDTDQFPTDLYSTTLCMYEVLKTVVLPTADLILMQRQDEQAIHTRMFSFPILQVWTLSLTVLSLPIKSFQTALWIVLSKTDTAHTPRASAKNCRPTNLPCRA